MPAGLIKESRLLDASPHGISPEETIRIAKDFEFLVLFTSKPGFYHDVRLAERIKEVNPAIKIAFVGPPVSVQPEQALNASSAIDFVARKEFDYTVAEFASGKDLKEIAGVSYREDGKIFTIPTGRSSRTWILFHSSWKSTGVTLILPNTIFLF